ncbi:site-2 protease family protein [Streptomyces roseochromogenus]|uniref:Zinc metalloprotease n=1 Tax=Streptomyces roseochromogenus subsp. oscitans DS 12.976 TaxID=1352936 RepID=V6KYU8_STRRC|nr:site-2 protease family protein [Streptomyces roseochromogenus]EST36626.1 peptidase M50 [Streptomyces roseochromogenus subsp. oscitans DS 12.976]
MDETLSLGRIGGVRVGLHWSVLVIVALVTVALARGRFPDAHPGHPAIVYWALALLAAVVFLCSLLAHELAHAVVARRNGVQVDGITLWMLGGAARLHSEAPTPAAELRIAGVGPLTSLVAGGVLAGVAAGLDALHTSGLVVEAFAWLAAINVLLAVFNALPAAPLDGGRLLRAFLWHRTGDRLRATRGASAAGRALGWFMVVTGFAAVLFGRDLSGLWPALIGWFLIGAATAEARQAEMRSALGGVPVSRVMTADPVTVPATATLADFLAEGPFGQYRHSAFPVLAADGSVAGVLTLRRVDATPPEARASTRADEVMRPLTDVVTAEPGEPVLDLLPRLETSPVRRALVLDQGRLVGILTVADITRALAWPTVSAPARH